MITLYHRPSCPFCRRTIAVLERLNLEFEAKDISDPTLATELVERGGKQQVPYLVDADKGVEMYESDDIIAHLQKEYGQSTGASKPRVHVSGSTCESCEG